MPLNLYNCLLVIALSINFSINAQDRSNFVHASETEDKTLLLDQIVDEYDASIKSLDQEDLTSKQRSALKKQLLERYNAGKFLIKSNKVIISGELYNYVNEIFKKIVTSNAGIAPNSTLVLFRDVNFNAFTLGDNIVFCNIGLLYRLDNQEQLALVLTHELAHNSNRHTFQDMLYNIRLETDEQLNKEINKILRSDYGHVTALNALLIPTILESKEMSRKQEYEADSLGLIYYLNSGFSAQNATELFEIMKLADSAYNTQAIDYFNLFQFSNATSVMSRYKNYSRSSSLGSFTPDTNEYEGFLGTHPLEDNRIEALDRQIDIPKSEEKTIDSSFQNALYWVHGEMVYSSISNQNFSDGMYYAIRMMEKYDADDYSKSAISFMSSMLAYYKTRRMSGKFIENQDPENDEVTDRNNYFLSMLSPAECLELSKSMRQKLNNGYSGIFSELADLTYEYHNKNLESLSLRIDNIEPQVKSTCLEATIKIIKEDPAVKGKL